MFRSAAKIALLFLVAFSFSGMARPRLVLARGEPGVQLQAASFARVQHSIRVMSPASARSAHPSLHTVLRIASDTPWTTHQGTYRVVAVSVHLLGQAPAPSVGTISERMQGDGDPGQGEVSVQTNLATIGVRLHIQVEAVDVGPAAGIDTTVCTETTVSYEYARALAHDPSMASADAIVLFTPHKAGCFSGGVTQGRLIELESPANGWIDPRMIEHELGHSLLELNHSGVASSVDHNTLDDSTRTGSQYGPDSVMGASPVGWSGVDQLVAGAIHLNQVMTVGKSGEYTIARRELVGTSSKPILLRIPLKGHTGFYVGNPPEEVVLEYEVQTGADADLRSGKTQVIAETWTETKRTDQRLVEMTWEVGRLTPRSPRCVIDLPTDHVTVTEVARNSDSVRLQIDMG